MKARVKFNNEIIDVLQVGTKTHLYDIEHIEFLDNSQDYWEKLKHQYAGMAMRGMLSGGWVEMLYKVVNSDGEYIDLLAHKANAIATALVNKLKEEK